MAKNMVSQELVTIIEASLSGDVLAKRAWQRDSCEKEPLSLMSEEGLNHLSKKSFIINGRSSWCLIVMVTT